jgi:Spy/CpxP family protein refolding chaperone
MKAIAAISLGLLLAVTIAVGQGTAPCPDCRMDKGAPAADASGQPCCPQMSMPGMMQQGMPMPGMKMQKEIRIIGEGPDLELTDEQQKQVDEIEYKSALETAKLRAELDVARLNFDYEMRKDQADEGKVKTMLLKIGELETSMRVADVMKKLKINKILTPEQRKMVMKAHRCACGKMMMP